MKKKGKQQKLTILPDLSNRGVYRTKTQTKKKDFSSIECKCEEIAASIKLKIAENKKAIFEDELLLRWYLKEED